MISIRKKLLILTFAVLAVGTLAMSVATYYTIRHEMDELYDKNMKQIAVMMSGTIVQKGKTISERPYSNGYPRGEEEFLIQVWRKGKLEYSSHPAANFPLQETLDKGVVFFEGKRWIYYAADYEGDIVQISQNLKHRREVVRETYQAVLIPILIQFPIMAFIVWLIIGYGFRPLENISALIKKRTASFLDPIPNSQVPAEISVLVDALNELLERLKLSLELQRQFTADAAHELRTPLTAVRLQLDLLQRAKTPQDQDEALKTLENGVSRSIRLVNQLLELARQEPENTLRSFSSTDLNALAVDALNDCKPLADNKNMTLLYEPSDKAIVMGDASSLSVMIGNLLNNAITYTRHGGMVLVKTSMPNDQVVLEIADNGVGIDQASRERIFDRFFRVTGTGTTGSGLGLSIVKNITDHHNIKVDVLDGLSGEGTCFRLTFPKA